MFHHLSFLFSSDTNPVKVIMGLVSLVYGVTDFIFIDSINIFSTMMLIYGVGIIWRIGDFSNKTAFTQFITLLGSSLWTLVAVSYFMASNISISHIIASTLFSITSIWLYVRCESVGEAQPKMK